MSRSTGYVLVFTGRFDVCITAPSVKRVESGGDQQDEGRLEF